MPNNNVFRGSDAALVLAVDDEASVEGGLAGKLIKQYDFSNTVGRLRNVQIEVHNDVKPFHEIGKRFASELRPGNISIFGAAERAHINGAMLLLLLGDGAQSPPPGGGLAQPSFNIVIQLKNPAAPDTFTKVVVFGVKFEKWSFTVLEDEFVMEAITFRAIRIATEESA
jgi:hypothetical protein